MEKEPKYSDIQPADMMQDGDMDELMLPSIEYSALEEAADEIDAAETELNELLDDGDAIDSIIDEKQEKMYTFEKDSDKEEEE